MKEKFPKNKNKFLKLIRFSQELAPILKKLKIKPVLCGSTAYFYYTHDKSAKINDIDFLVPRKSMQKLIKELKKSKIKTRFIKNWESIIAGEETCRIDFDCFERYYLGKAKKFKKAAIGGEEFSILGLSPLTLAYEFAARASKDKPKEHQRKLNVLKKLEN